MTMLEYLIILAMGIAAGYLIGSVGAKQQRNEDIQRLIDLEATSRRADGLYRRGDILTQYEAVESSAGVAREMLR